jgi:hypothetical protein
LYPKARLKDKSMQKFKQGFKKVISDRIIQMPEDSVHQICCQLKQAVDCLEGSFEEEWPADPLHPINQETAASTRAILRLQLSLDKIFSVYTTKRVIDFLKRSKVDFTLLLYLQLPESLRKKSELISYLETICKNMKVNYKTSHFYNTVWNCFTNDGIAAITPDKFITANKKDEILAEYERVKKSWGKHSPLFLQTYSTKDGNFTNHLYHITRTVPDGILRLIDILKAGEFVANGRVYEACGAFEHVISPHTLTCQIYDCEILSSAFETKTTEEIKEMVQCFPQCITSIMIEKDFINVEDIITFAVKDRTRKVDETTIKISYHFIPNICAPKHMHRDVMDICLMNHKIKIDEAVTSIKQTGILPECQLSNDINDSLIALDYSAIKSNGFTTAFSRKKKNDPYSRMVYAEQVCAGATIQRFECFKDPQDLHSTNITEKERLMMLYLQLFTSPKIEMMCYTEDAMKTLKKKVRSIYYNFSKNLALSRI